MTTVVLALTELPASEKDGHLSNNHINEHKTAIQTSASERSLWSKRGCLRKGFLEAAAPELGSEI